MSRITRKLQKIFAGSATNNGQFGSGKTGAKVTSTDLDVIQSLAAWGTGWLDAIISSQDLPPLEEMQSTNYVNTTQLAYLFQEGVPEWETATTYYQYSVVKKTNTYDLYGSLTDSNTGNALTDATNWVYLGSLLQPVSITMGLDAVAPAGKLLISGGSIAKTSGATYNSTAWERHYTYWWNNVSSPSGNTIAPVSGGLGASAAADFAANKKLTMPSWANMSPYGVGTLAAGQSGGSSSITPTGTYGTTGSHTLDISEIPSHTHDTPLYGTVSASSSTTMAGITSIGTHATSGATGGGGGHTHPGGAITVNAINPLHPVFGVYYYIG